MKTERCADASAAPEGFQTICQRRYEKASIWGPKSLKYRNGRHQQNSPMGLQYRYHITNLDTQQLCRKYDLNVVNILGISDAKATAPAASKMM